jgi:hypothetical protein
VEFTEIVGIEVLYYENIKEPFKCKCLPSGKYAVFTHRGRVEEAYYGDIIKLLPPNTEEDILQSIKIETASLYHYLCHLYVHGNFDTLDEELKQAYKLAFFIVQLKYNIDTKTYISSKYNLIDMIGGTEKEILKTNMNWNELKEDIENNKDRYFELLFEWCKKIINM